MTKSSVPKPTRKPSVPGTFPLVNRNTIDFTKEHETPVPYLYPDSKGLITTGAGFNVDDNPRKAFDLGMYWMEEDGVVGKRRASVDHISKAYEKIRSVPTNYRHTYFNPRNNQNFSKIFMKDEDIDYHLTQKLHTFEKELKRKIPHFEEFPYTARRALLDMQFNLGDGEFRGEDKKWPEMFKAIDRRDWEKAADESHRPDVQKERNDVVRDLFLQAHREKNRYFD